MNLSRKTLIGTFALAATLSAPLAFAQSQTATPPAGASAQSTSTTDASAQSTTPADSTTQSAPPAAQPTTSNDASAAAHGSMKKSWADVDADKSGSLSKAEASSVPALAQVFDQADTNADGSLSPDEYKAYVKASKSKK